MDARRLGNIILVLSIILPVQFLLGMWVNLFVKIPDPFELSFFPSGDGIVLIVHILNALAIVTLTIIAAVLASRINRPIPFRLLTVATLFVFLAIGSGITFAFFGQKDVFSYTMAIGFVTSVSLIAFSGRFLMLAAKPKTV